MDELQIDIARIEVQREGAGDVGHRLRHVGGDDLTSNRPAAGSGVSMRETRTWTLALAGPSNRRSDPDLGTVGQHHRAQQTLIRSGPESLAGRRWRTGSVAG